MRAAHTILVLPIAIVASSIDSCCSRLSHALGSVVTYPGQARYNTTEDGYFSLQESSLLPACIVEPSSAEEVAQCVSIISATENCTFAVKSGGHAPATGFANIQDGVTIDMAGLNSTILSNDGSFVSVGSGAKWVDVYSYLESFGLAAAGGRNGLVGVGGLLLGGGLSHFSPRVGWACDNVVNFEVVLADGRLIDANETSHSDLYRALKGGGNNLGIVTRFDLATFSQGNISSTSLIFDISEVDGVFHAFTGIASSADFDVYTSLVTGLIYNSTSQTWIISASAVYTKAILGAPVYSELLAVPSISQSSELISVAALANETPTSPFYWLFATITVEPSYDFLIDLFHILNTTLRSFAPAGGILWDIALEPLPSVLLTHATTRGGNVLGLKPSIGNSVIILISGLWSDNSASETAQQVAKEAISKAKSSALAKGVFRSFEYTNYAAPLQRPLASYGADNIEFLRTTSKKYDKSGTFQHRLVGGFKLW